MDDLSIPALIIVLVIAFAVIGWLIMVLWNWLMPVLFLTPTIDFWQALGLLGLTTLLFKKGK